MHVWVLGPGYHDLLDSWPGGEEEAGQGDEAPEQVAQGGLPPVEAEGKQGSPNAE